MKKHKLFHNFIYDFVKITAIPGLLYYRPKYIHFEHEPKERIRGGALVISNHVGFADPIYVMMGIWYRRHRFVCMKEFYEKKFVAWLFNRFHCIPIDRENFNIASFREIIDALKNDEMVSMFPEGHVNFEGDGLNQFKSGMVLMALMSGKPVVPVYIENRKSVFERLKIGIGAPFDVTAVYGRRPNMKQVGEIADMLFRKEEELRNYCRTYGSEKK